MKKRWFIIAVLSLMTTLCSCSAKTGNDDIYSKIHNLYYDMNSYSASCTVTAFTPGGENTYNCDIHYDKKNGNYDVLSEDMRIVLTKDKTIITKGQNSIESPSIPGDMYIFINTFFKSYYESEDTSVSVNGAKKSKTVLLECSALNPTDYITSMKLWVNSKTAMPHKMQVLGSDEKVNTEIIFNKFLFE